MTQDTEQPALSSETPSVSLSAAIARRLPLAPASPGLPPRSRAAASPRASAAAKRLASLEAENAALLARVASLEAENAALRAKKPAAKRRGAPPMAGALLEAHKTLALLVRQTMEARKCSLRAACRHAAEQLAVGKSEALTKAQRVLAAHRVSGRPVVVDETYIKDAWKKFQPLGTSLGGLIFFRPEGPADPDPLFYSAAPPVPADNK